ncbi:MAG: hypothetical protein KIT84_26815 [Labilithrix sp.]|nr:hypothetical protein [Labilithrix sp.]MCW5814667.1 hypothetical protein [Labilithrix sp.]
MRPAFVRLGLALAGAALAAACTTATTDDEEDDTGLGEQAVSSLDPSSAPATAITEPAALRQLEKMGFGFGHHFDQPDDATADKLATTKAWSSIAAAMDANLDELQRNDRELKVGMAASHRLFDRRWLRSSRSRFELVAVTNRIDRAAASGGCGETRFVYRLAYADPREGATSRMPMTVAVVHSQLPRDGETGCAPSMNRWLSLGGSGATLADAAAKGPLSGLDEFVTLETNLQAVRWPSSVRKDMGGEAQYMLNVWERTADGGMTAKPLDNTPDIPAITADPAKRAALVKWVKDNVYGIDHGTATLPAELSAKTVYSHGPRGFARLVNQPFSQLLDESDLRTVAYGNLTHVKSARGLVRKLDQESCQGCHQNRAMAGFHVLGNEDDRGTNSKLNRLAVGTSPHFNEELAWRMRLVRAVANGADAAKLEEARPFAEHATNDGLAGASCGLGADPSFADWSCMAGLKCADMIGQGTIGVCVTDGAPKPGEACEKDRITTSTNPNQDKVQNLDPGDALCARGTPGGSCSGASGGFPGGACFAICNRMGQLKDRVICGAAPPSGFNECMARGRESFEKCMSPPKLALRQACNVDIPCRDDYVCSYVPGAPAGTGACMPPYFIFQARIDGHD